MRILGCNQATLADSCLIQAKEALLEGCGELTAPSERLEGQSQRMNESEGSRWQRRQLSHNQSVRTAGPIPLDTMLPLNLELPYPSLPASLLVQRTRHNRQLAGSGSCACIQLPKHKERKHLALLRFQPGRQHPVLHIGWEIPLNRQGAQTNK